jgi:hypothetical protein
MLYLLDIMPWLEQHMLACPSKKYLNIECPGCGFQRSLLALFKGEFIQSLSLYPATIPLLFMLVYTFLHVKYRFINGARNIKYFQLICAVIIVMNYIHNIINQN